MATPTLNSILLSSTDPQRLHDWYAEVLPPDSDDAMEQYRVLTYGGFYLMIDTRDDVGAKAAEPGRMILNFDVDDAQGVVARIDRVGGDWLAPLEDREGSLFATAIDPDGNYVQVIQLSDEARAAMSDQAREA
jgi:predicted enzyme related to lactoylglutathione lyase